VVLTLLYNLAVAAAVVAALISLRWRRSPASWLAALVGVGAVAVLLGPWLAESGFSLFRLWAYGLFVHATLLLAGSAAILWKRPRWLSICSALLAGLLAAVAVDAFLIEPTWLEVTRVELPNSKLTQRVRLVVLADLQTDRIGAYERNVLRRVLQEKPDLILFAGDYLQTDGKRFERLRNEFNRFLHEIGFSAPQGTFAVGGNVDPAGWPEIFSGLPVEVIRVSSSFEVAGMHLTCLGITDSFDHSLVIHPPADDGFHIVLGHSPDYALGSIGADLLIAGHTHGGQVRLPLIGPPAVLSRIPRAWSSGINDLPGGGKLLVSRGVGMERGGAPRLRFLCRPELVVIDLVPRVE